MSSETTTICLKSARSITMVLDAFVPASKIDLIGALRP
jgi:hypothetical protein